jgi:hypothetical protein
MIGGLDRYALLILPSANRVYADSAVALTQAELAVFDATVLGNRLEAVERATIAGVPYVTFSAAGGLAEADVAYLSNLSSLYALFRVEGELLRPVPLRKLDRFDDDLLTIQKYAGKTNEQFTKLLLNVTVLASGFATELLDRQFSVIDPLCGRGTTLNQAMMYGFDVAGIDLDGKDFEAYATFIQRWLKDKRIKHKAEQGPIRRNKQTVGRRLHIEFAADKDAYRSGNTQLVDVVNADTTRALEFYRAGSCDLVVADLPYGVQHGSRSGPGRSLARSPLELLGDAAPVWAALLRHGGALGLSWNTFVATREDAAARLAAAGLEPLLDAPFAGFRHRVDQAISRDILIARKP